MTVAPNDSVQSLARLIEAAARLAAHMHHAGRATDPNEEIAHMCANLEHVAREAAR